MTGVKPPQLGVIIITFLRIQNTVLTVGLQVQGMEVAVGCELEGGLVCREGEAWSLQGPEGSALQKVTRRRGRLGGSLGGGLSLF